MPRDMTESSRETVVHATDDSLHPIVRLRDRLVFLARNPLFAYLTIVALQLKVIWRIWDFKDLPFGDTANYYGLAHAWHAAGADFFAWSPLYTTFLGSFLSLSSNAYFVTTAHRVVIVLALAILVLALMRSLLSPIVAWWTTVWWVLLPINFDSLYDVHLFFVVLILIVYLAVLHLPAMLGRSIGVAMLLAISVLMRNEMLVPLILFGSIALGFDLWRCFRRRTVRLPSILLTYGVPLLLAVLLCVFFYERSLYKGPVLQRFLVEKHTLNVCQIYAFSYQQQHPEWAHSPWTECKLLIQTTFGEPEVTLWGATLVNPGAMLKYFWWNIKLIPSGLQVLLFNMASGRDNPDYAPVEVNPAPALLGSFVLIGILTWGAVVFFRNRREWFDILMRPRIWLWIIMGCVASVVIIIMITERPRPSYMFTLGILLMALTGLSVQLIAWRWSWPSAIGWLFPIAAVALIAFTPCYYRSPRFGSRPHLDVYQHMRPFQQIIDPNVGVIAPNAATDLCLYLARIPNRRCKGINYWGFRDSTPKGADWNQALKESNVKFFLANEGIMRDPAGAAFIRSAESNGWQVLELENLPGNRWMLLEKR
jgi:hypothetical protein